MYKKTEKNIIVLSGGLDSTILLYHMIHNLKIKRRNIIALSFKLQNQYILNTDANKCLYQNNIAELEFAKKTTKKLKIKHIIVDLTYMNEILNVMRNDKRFNVKSKKRKKETTSLPYRNMVMLSNALMYAEIYKCQNIYLGYQKQDQYGYWDTKSDFLESIQNTARLNPDHKIKIHTPFLNYDKKTEIELAKKINVPLEDTWTCYNPLMKRLDYLKNNRVFYSCKQCKSCLERLSNFEKLKINDPQKYWNGEE